MINVTAQTRSIIDDGSFEYHCAVSSWLGSELLAENIPVNSATEETDLGLRVPERITLRVPREMDGVKWLPTSTTDPLSASGQILKIALGVGRGPGTYEWFPRGDFVLVSADADGDEVLVTAAGRLHLVAEAGFVVPFQPSGTLAGTLRALIEPALSVDLVAAPADRAVPATVNYDDRLDAVYELLDAWPAAARMTEQGFLQVTADTVPTAAVRSFTTAYGGTVIRSLGSSTREGGFNVVVATGNADDGGEVRGLAYVTEGPWAYGVGPANPLPVPFGFPSPLLRTNAQCTAAASTVLHRKQREALSRRWVVECTPDPTLQAGDPVAVTNDEVTDQLCTVQALSLPYLPGQMTAVVVSV
jgi:hypothetical protein